MNARLMAASMFGGFALAALLFSGWFSGQIAAQTGASGQGNGLFSTLRVGQMVEFNTDGWGLVLKTYDEEEFKFAMRHTVKEIGVDYIVVEFDGTNTASGVIEEYRLPVYRFSQVLHMGKVDPKKKAAAVSPNAADNKNDKKTALPDKKPAMPKKKN